MASSSRSDGSLLTEINVTPLVDVVLVLLILMMVTATTLAAKTIPVELPKAKTGEAGEQARPLVVTLDAEGRMFIEDAPASDDLVRSRARALIAKSGTDASAVLAADGRARHHEVVHALELMRAERLSKIAIVVRRGDR